MLMLDNDRTPMKRLGMVRCPAHDDKTPSLWVGKDTDGRLALKCLAGCAETDVRARLGGQDDSGWRGEIVGMAMHADSMDVTVRVKHPTDGIGRPSVTWPNAATVTIRQAAPSRIAS